jgi:transcriptional regulator with XRE-family HTH domain
MTYYPKVMGKVYARLRKQGKMTQAQLAVKLGLDTSVISRIETGRSSPNVPQHLEICKALKISPAVPFNNYGDQVDHFLKQQGVQP